MGPSRQQPRVVLAAHHGVAFLRVLIPSLQQMLGTGAYLPRAATNGILPFWGGKITAPLRNFFFFVKGFLVHSLL